MIAEGNLAGFRQMINKSIDILFTFAFPVVICAVIFSPQIIQVLSGDGYEGAFLPTRIMMPLIFIIGYEQILVHQILMPLKYDKVIFINSIIGALVGIALNLILVSKVGAVGSSITWLLSEIAVFVFAQIQVARLVGIAFPFKRFMQYLLCYLPSIAICLVYYKYIHTSDFITLLIIALFMSFYTLLVQIRIIKNEHVLQITDKLIRFIR
jgi:O-antigen/teichoic acid export membrane protein